ncbi:cardiolipin synthase [Xaviernesmea oryzae]|uniref:Phospholipase D n=1 Tax=Xaviernesmea oryzae TaxID=464029 RepID=A0A1Q9ASU5_9HYPH|nr:phospholipase D family protein [Xaviernesmea oryzae]OLP58504.1 cardiolipin synthase [Xaviernesmea oryzae]SEK59565.1 Phosphatidylserine/phosphatidylglycerophosphate/cardiolipin synthase [Xaviernesmea oryzae]
MLTILMILTGLVVGLVGLSAIYAWGRFGRRPQGQPARALPPLEDQTEIDRLAAPLLDAHEGENGVALLIDNVDAFAARALSARRAGRSLDLQYYYWKKDLTGRLLAAEVLAAADRGVKVRLLLDDINAGLHDAFCLSLDAHENIEVRLFNPSRARTDRLRRGLEMMARPLSATRRMHNKAWIADGRVTIAGGRNIGDAYFDAAEQANFRDLDMWMLGSMAEDASDVFDAYWNSPVVLPIGALRTPRRHYLPRLRRKLARIVRKKAARHYLDHVDRLAQEAGLFHGTGPLRWTSEVRMVADPPEKAHMARRQNWLMDVLMPVIRQTRTHLRIISPYFIPGVNGVKELSALTQAGAQVSVLTNSLAATDVAAVHGAYANYRRRLLKAGVRLYELKAEREPNEKARLSLFGSRHASLHTKAFTLDGRTGFVGSMNFDPRSASLNTEMGVLITCPDLIADIDAIFTAETAPVNSFRLALEGRKLIWSDEQAHRARRLRREPEAGFWRWAIAAVIGVLPIESQL